MSDFQLWYCYIVNVRSITDAQLAVCTQKKFIFYWKKLAVCNAFHFWSLIHALIDISRFWTIRQLGCWH